MFISQLRSKLNAYDPFGEFRTNGLKGLFVVELMFIFNYFYSVDNPYFYFFYLPLTAFAAEIAGTTVKDKYTFLFFALSGSTVLVFCYGLISYNPTFFIVFVFVSSCVVYYIAIFKIKSMMVAAPTILGLAAYSLLYGDSDANFFVALNNALKSVVASVIIFAGLYIFPKSFYLSIWKKALCDVLLTLNTITEQIKQGEIKDVPIFKGFMIMGRYSKMMSRRMKYYSIIKITLLALHLVTEASYLSHFHKSIKKEYIVALQKYTSLLYDACMTGDLVTLTGHDKAVIKSIEELNTIHRLILSWNYLCSAR